MNTIVCEHEGRPPVVIIDAEDAFNINTKLFGFDNDVKHVLEFCLNEKSRLGIDHPDAMIVIIVSSHLFGIISQSNIDNYLNNAIWIIDGEHEDFAANAQAVVAELNYHAQLT